MSDGIRYDQIQAEINRSKELAQADIPGRRKALGRLEELARKEGCS